MDRFEIDCRKVEIKNDWMIFIAECKGKMFKHLDRSYNETDFNGLIGGLYKELEEFEQSTKPISNKHILESDVEDFDEMELCDIANFCMMLFINKRYPRG